jgi:hypothetical protein
MAQATRTRSQARPTPTTTGGGGPVIPFTSAAHEHTEPFFDQTFKPGANVTNFGPINIPSYGYLRHVYMQITAVGGALGTGELGADYPFNLFSSLSLVDTNGAPIFGPMDGFATEMCNIVGGYGFKSDPRSTANCPWFVGTINAEFPLRIPVEISHHDALGSLANQNSAASYQVMGSISTFAQMMKTVGTATAPEFRVRMFLEAWSLPNETDRAGRPQAQLPPAHGTTQYWSQSVRQVSVGNNTLPITRTGNLIRNMIFICRNAAGERKAAVCPDPMILQWDARQLLMDTQKYREHAGFAERANLTSYPVGVFVFPFSHSIDNLIGDDNPSLWLPTVQATRLELDGTAAEAGTMQQVINDIAPGEVVPSDRYVETSETGFHPQVGTTTPGTQ